MSGEAEEGKLQKQAKKATSIHTSVQYAISKPITEYTDNDEKELGAEWVPLTLIEAAKMDIFAEVPSKEYIRKMNPEDSRVTRLWLKLEKWFGEQK